MLESFLKALLTFLGNTKVHLGRTNHVIQYSQVARLGFGVSIQLLYGGSCYTQY